jgi:hypothetical protein
MQSSFPVLAAIREHTGSRLDNGPLGGSLTALLGRFDEARPRLARLHAATLAAQDLPTYGDRLPNDSLWVEWSGAGDLLAARLDRACAVLFWPIADGPYRGALAANMVGIGTGRPFAFPGAVIVESGVYLGEDSITDQLRASYDLPTAQDAAPEALAAFNRQVILLDGEYLVAGTAAPAYRVAYNCRRSLLPESDAEALRYAMLATAVLRPETDQLLHHDQSAVRQTAERMAAHLAEHGPAAALRLLRAAAGGAAVH